MAHLSDSNKKIKSRIRKIKGQLEAVERALEQNESDCFSILQTLSACRGGLNGLLTELIEMHVREHVMDSPHEPKSSQDKSAIELIKLIKTYWK